MQDSSIPIFYAVAMGVDAFAGIDIRETVRQNRSQTLILAIILSAFFAPLDSWADLTWHCSNGSVGIGMGAQETILKAEIPTDSRQ
jgi:hypothetical protein